MVISPLGVPQLLTGEVKIVVPRNAPNWDFYRISRESGMSVIHFLEGVQE